MNPVLRTLVLVGVALIAGFFLISSYASRIDSHEFQLEQARLKQGFITRTSIPRHLPEARQKDWKDEVRSVSRWYFEELAAIYNRHPAQKSRPIGLDALKKEKEEGKIKEADWPTYEEWFKLAEVRYNELRDNKYDVIMSGSDQGLHFDVLSIKADSNPSSKKKGLKIDFAIWGVPQITEKDTVPGSTKVVTRTRVPVEFKQLAFKCIDEKGQIYAEMSGSAVPYQKVADPDRWIEDFPPSILYGTWYVDLFPFQTAKVEMTLALEGRGNAGADLPANFKWEFPVQADERLEKLIAHGLRCPHRRQAKGGIYRAALQPFEVDLERGALRGRRLVEQVADIDGESRGDRRQVAELGFTLAVFEQRELTSGHTDSGAE